MFRALFERDFRRQQALAEGLITPNSSRCVQCGICSYSCPLGIDVRAHASQGLTISTGECITCGECASRCPRGVLTLRKVSLNS